MKGVTSQGSADFHYYNWVDIYNTLGLGENIPIANGSGSDSLQALDPRTGEWVIMRVPYPMGFYSRGLDGRIDDSDVGWKGRGVWANYGTNFNWHTEGGKGSTSKMVKIHFPKPIDQMNPNELEKMMKTIVPIQTKVDQMSLYYSFYLTLNHMYSVLHIQILN